MLYLTVLVAQLVGAMSLVIVTKGKLGRKAADNSDEQDQIGVIEANRRATIMKDSEPPLGKLGELPANKQVRGLPGNPE